MVLTAKDREKLHESIVEYLGAHRSTDLASQVKASLQSGEFSDRDTNLERKFSIVLRLTRKNQELEERVKALENEVRDLRDPTKAGAASSGAGASNAVLLPVGPALHTFAGHRDTLTSVALHLHDPIAFTASEDGTIRVWDLDSRRSLKTLREHTESVACLAVESQEGKVLASGSKDATVKLFDIETDEFRCTSTLHHDAAVTDVKWDPTTQATLVSSTRGGDIAVWDTARGAVKAMIKHGTWIHTIAVASGMVAAGDHEECVALYSLASRQVVRTFTEHSNVVETTIFSNAEVDAYYIQHHGTADQRSFLRELERQREQLKLQQRLSGAAVNGSSSTPNGVTAAGALLQHYHPRFVVSGGRDKNVVMRDATSGLVAFVFEGHENWVRALAFTRSGHHLVTCADDGLMMIVDLATKKLARRIVVHDHFATCLALHPLGKPIAMTGSADSTAKLWACKPA